MSDTAGRTRSIGAMVGGATFGLLTYVVGGNSIGYSLAMGLVFALAWWTTGVLVRRLRGRRH